MKSNMQNLGSCHRKRNSIFQPALDTAFGHGDKFSASLESCTRLSDKGPTWSRMSLSPSQPGEVLPSHPSEDGLKLLTRHCFSDMWQSSLAPCPIQPSGARRVESSVISPCLISSPSRQPHSPGVPYLQDSHLIAEAGEEMVGLSWKKLSSQLYRKTSLGSAMSTHTSTEDLPAQLLQKLFLPAPQQQPGSFVGCSPTGKASAVGVNSFHCGNGPVLSSWSDARLSGPQ